MADRTAALLFIEHGRGICGQVLTPYYHITFVIGESRGLANISAILFQPPKLPIIFAFLHAVG